MDMENMARLMQMFMSSSEPETSEEETPAGENAGESFFDNIDFDMISKMGELFTQMNKPDRNAELLLALKPHLRDENQHKIDSAVKMSRMMSMIPFLKDSGILNDLF